MRQMEPFVFLFLLPVMIGVASQLWLRDVRHASLVATIGSVAAIYVLFGLLDPEWTWSWFAAFLVMPLPIASALAAVLVCYGRGHTHRHRRPRGS
jgi:hypothetical protein